MFIEFLFVFAAFYKMAVYGSSINIKNMVS